MPRNQRVKEPDRDAFHEAQAKKDEQIEKERKNLKKLFDQAKLLREGGKVGGTNISLREFMNKKKSEQDALQKQIDKEEKLAKHIEDDMEAITEQKAKLQNQMLKGFKHEDEIRE